MKPEARGKTQSRAEEELDDFFRSTPSHADYTRGMFSLGPLAIAAGLFYLGYRVGGAIEDVSKAINRLLDTVDEVRNQVAHILNRIDELFDRIDRLSKEIKGHIDMNELRSSLALVDAEIQILKTYMRDEDTLNQNFDQVRFSEGQLIRHMNRVLAVTEGGMSGIFLVAPAMPVWTHTFTTIQRKLAKDASQDKPTLSIWDSYFHKKVLSVFLELFANSKQLSEYYRAEMACLLPEARHSNAAIFNGNCFNVTTIPWKGLYEDDEGEANWFTSANYERRHLASTRRVWWKTSSPRWVWIWYGTSYDPRVFAHPAHVKAATQRFNELASLKPFADNHESVMGDAAHYEQMVRDVVANKPSDWP